MSTSRRGFLAGLAAPAILPERAGRPNLLFIAIDDLNDWIGCLGGHPDIRTPHLDRLASRGVLFTNAHCAAPLCNPSRAALMTGIRPSTSGVYDNNQPFRLSAAGRNTVTLPQHFMAHGYRVTGAGKIYHNPFPDPASWHDYFPSEIRTKPPDPLPPNPPLNGIPNTAHFDWGPLDVPDSEMGDSKVADWIVSRLSRPQSQPFFLACGFFRPHLPWYVPRKYFDRYPAARVTLPEVKEDDLDDVPPAGRKFARPEGDHRKVIQYNQWRGAVQGYLASISFVDTCVGRVVDALERGPHAAGTVVVLWSDHGWHLGEKLHWRKFSLWEEATRNVLMIVAPGVTHPGGRCGRSVSLMDIYPTVTELCGLPAARAQEGRSLLPLLRNPAAAWDRPAVTTYLRGNHSVRSERWRYVRYSDGGEELYDHRADPMEWRNLAGEPGYKAGIERLAAWLPREDAPDSPRGRGVDPPVD
ncbi:MAG: sulfatase [Bryobacterales bacterium]|nr:sulfatase [Bryobacterales bacterium]